MAAEDFLDDMLKRRLSLDDEAAPIDAAACKAYPRLFLGCTCTDAGNGYLREPWTISVKAGAGCWSATVRDDTLKYTLKVSSETLDDLWSAIELELSKPKAAWDPMRGKQPVLRKRRDPRG